MSGADLAYQIIHRAYLGRMIQEMNLLEIMQRAKQDARDIQAFEWLRERTK